ncbi:hypothetical protein BKA61DRAFT_658496 [Leptodontidium sp. MPI-SDFR-AT-0119]|nr:hypothetical protein BKA61DRAFT_658496 [Leptodontidium sp. MPI-SDFR-AT-0119]
MMWDDTRAQVLANLKFLYGPDVEVVTLRDELHQAVAVNFHPLNNTTWTKYLHGEPAASFHQAMWNLLTESEREVAKFFSVNGNAVPFKGDMAQILSLGRGQRGDSSAGSSLQSDFVFIATPGSTVPNGTVPKDPVEEGTPVEEYTTPEPAVEEDYPVEESPPPAVEEDSPIEESPPPAVEEDSPIEEYPAPVVEEDSPIEEYPTPAPTIEEAISEPVDETPRAVSPEPGALCNEPEPASEEIETFDFGWRGWRTSKKDKKKQKAVLTFDLPALVQEYQVEDLAEEPSVELAVHPVEAEEHPAEVEVYAVECTAEESIPVEVYSVECTVEESPAPEPEPVTEEDLGWGSYITKKNKKGKKSSQDLVEIIQEPIPEPEPVVEDAWGIWGATTKKSKKKKRGVCFESTDPADEAPAPAPSPEPEPVVEDTWETWGASTKKSKKNKDRDIEVPSELVPEPVVDVDIWVPPMEKGKKTSFVPEPEPDEWAQFSISKRSKKGKKGVPGMPLGEESSTAKEPSAEVLEVPPAPEPVKHSAVAPQATSTGTAPHAIQPPAPRSGQTVVFTVQFPDEIDTKPLQAMITLADNTRAAIFDAVRSYLHSKSLSTCRRSLQRLEIKSGAGKNGDVDLSTLEETMWPEYLEYFRQYTRLPELTVDCFCD